MCSHILEIVEKLCTRVAVINQGRIVAQGKFDEIRQNEREGLEDIFMRLVEGNGENGDAGPGAPKGKKGT
jgi:ABC-2 type transport system ATP-binding protein